MKWQAHALPMVVGTLRYLCDAWSSGKSFVKLSCAFVRGFTSTVSYGTLQ